MSETKEPDQAQPNHPQQPTAVKPASEPVAQPGPAPRRPRTTWTVYCETCQKNFYTVVLGRGQVKYSKAQAERRALEHRREHPEHALVLRSSLAEIRLPGLPAILRSPSAAVVLGNERPQPRGVMTSAAAEGER